VTTTQLGGVLVGAAVEARPVFETAVLPLHAALVRRLVLVQRDPDEAEDVAQDAFVRALGAWDRFDGADGRAWLYTIALPPPFDRLRQRRRWLGRLGRPSATATYVDRVDPDLWAALDTLEPRVRAALLASAVDGYTHREIAAMRAIPEGTGASWLSRARASLRQTLGD
jgi:RNA polymerase sigma-70 factor (ECF subfamily)